MEKRKATCLGKKKGEDVGGGGDEQVSFLRIQID